MSVEPKSDATTRAEIASLDRIRRSPSLGGWSSNLGQAIEFRGAARHRANVIFLCRDPTTNMLPDCAVFCALIKNSRFVITAHTSVTFRTNDLRKSIPIVRAPRQATNVEQSLRPKGDTQCS